MTFNDDPRREMKLVRDSTASWTDYARELKGHIQTS